MGRLLTSCSQEWTRICGYCEVRWREREVIKQPELSLLMGRCPRCQCLTYNTVLLGVPEKYLQITKRGRLTWGES